MMEKMIMYVDPNTGGMLFQLLAGLFVVISGFILVFSGKIRMFFARLRRGSKDEPVVPEEVKGEEDDEGEV